MISNISLQDLDMVEQVWLLQHLAFRLEASAIGLTQIPHLPETFESLSQSEETFYGEITDDGDLLGAIAVAEDSPGRLMITRLMVQPDHLRKGIGSRLLRHVLEHHPHIRHFMVNAGIRNHPAMELYQKFGFDPVKSYMADLGVELLLMQRDG
ncbi:GNAT family N-acetyltransferase [Paenibacillus sp. YPG26]|uniref:GNAT family N-acetyltransferase n=1 Tax=Paenibacillus sp. YPG26 TaxID=2878915 RepID=UPI002040A20D|nr:GNAT family N-acetyltransferase [Paenibacillus sp. YPG26]USB32597.1 GNAT family N-acetyltransferase [Paenibacillus sp. YPG26]